MVTSQDILRENKSKEMVIITSDNLCKAFYHISDILFKLQCSSGSPIVQLLRTKTNRQLGFV